jgi:protein subunit release factor A
MRAKNLGRERSSLQLIVETIDTLDIGISDAFELLEIAFIEKDIDTVREIESDLKELTKGLVKLEFSRMFSGPMDPNNAYLDIQSGSGGTEAQDWAEMVLRMYLRWGEMKGFRTVLEEVSSGDVAGIKSATIHFEVSMHLDGFEQKLEYIGLLESHRLIPEVADILHFALFSFLQRLMMILISKLILQMCEQIHTEQAALVDSTSIRQIQL